MKIWEGSDYEDIPRGQVVRVVKDGGGDNVGDVLLRLNNNGMPFRNVYTLTPWGNCVSGYEFEDMGNILEYIKSNKT